VDRKHAKTRSVAPEGGKPAHGRPEDRGPDAPVDRDTPERERVRDRWERDPSMPERAVPAKRGRQPSETE
jgi:hypothetical protein